MTIAPNPPQFKVSGVPAFQDNYLWLVETGANRAVVVDPGDAKPIIAALESKNLTLSGILITHHHPDHIGGLQTLIDLYHPPVYGPAGGSVPGITHPVVDGDTVTVDDHDFSVLALPGHTLDHLAYYSVDEALVFCGDTLFAAGCGRLFEGTPAQMHESLMVLAKLPEDTKVYCAHEYTLANLKFAHAVEPDNLELNERITRETAKRAQHIPTIPSTIGLEKQTNPFLRVNVARVKHAAEQEKGQSLATGVDVFAALRAWKDSF